MIILRKQKIMRLSNFRENDRVLLLGEGNFSFAVSLFKHNLPITITASCYDSSVLHDSTKSNVDFLRNNGIRVLLGVDGTKISEHPFLKTQTFDKIIFNFPHVGGKMRLDKNRELLENFFISVEKYRKFEGTILMTLCNGQGGTSADVPHRRWDDSWKVREMAAHGNFVVAHVEPFRAENFVEYNCTGYRGREKEFWMKNSLTHFFVKAESPSLQNLAPTNRLNLSEVNVAEGKVRYRDIFPVSADASDPPIFQFDLTFSDARDFWEIHFYTILYNLVGKIVKNVEFIRSYRFPDGTTTKTYRIFYQSDLVPLYRRRVVDIHQRIVAKILLDNLNLVVTP